MEEPQTLTPRLLQSPSEEQWINLLKQVDSDAELNHTNILDKCKEVFKTDPALYEDWKENGFHVDHLLKINTQDDDVSGKYSNIQSLLHLFSKYGMANAVKCLVKYGANVNKMNAYDSSPLLVASINGNLDIVKELLNNGAKLTINEVNEDGYPPLLRAMYLGHVEIANVLIENGANVKIKSKNNTTVLHYAAMHDLDTVKRLVALKVDINDLNDFGKTPLHYCVKNGKLDILKYFIEDKGSDASIVKGPVGTNLVQYAAEHGQLEVLKYLVEDVKLDYETPDKIGKSAIYYAAEAHKDSLNIVKYLVEDKGVNYNVLANNMLTPMLCASMRSNMEVMKYLVEEKHVDVKFQDEEEGYTALYLACANTPCSLEAVKYLMEKGADANVKTKKMRTPVHGAAYNGKLDVIKYLVEELGVDIDHTDKYGHGVLIKAVEQGELEAAKYFIEQQNIDVNTKDISDRTILHVAVHSGNLDLVKYLVDEKGAKKYIHSRRLDNRWTPVHESTSKGYDEITEFLLKVGARVNTSDLYGNFPIHKAAAIGCEKNVALLLKHGSNLNPKDSGGWTPLHKAAKQGDLKTVKLLVENGANIDIRNKFNETAADVAMNNGKQEVVDYFKSVEPETNATAAVSSSRDLNFKSFAGGRRHFDIHDKK